MGKREAAVQETRDRIVQATLELHAEQGVTGTSWDDIAERAGVGVGTVYRHFRSFDELLPACGTLTWEKLKLPSPSIFDGVIGQRNRLFALTHAIFSLYERGEHELTNIREESGFHPVLAEAEQRVDDALDGLVAAAVDREHKIVRALTDLGTWKSLRRIEVDDPATTVATLLNMTLGDCG